MASEEEKDGSSSRCTVTSLVRSRTRLRNKDKPFLWQNLLFVKENPEIEKLARKQLDLQEQKFELMHTEASYNRRLEMLRIHFYENTQLKLKDNILTEREYKDLFSNIREVKACSDGFLADLEQLWQKDVFLIGIFDLLIKHFQVFYPYIRYCKDQTVSMKLLKSKTETNPTFDNLVKESCQMISSECSLSLNDMLGLPRIRLTAMIMAIGRAHEIMRPDDDEYESCTLALAAIKQLTSECNESIRTNEDIEMLLELVNTLCYPEDVPVFALAVTGRGLQKEGLLTHHASLNGNLQEKAKPHPQLKLMLFNDLLLILEPTPRTGDGMVVVKDYCKRSMAEMLCLNLESSDSENTHIILLRMKENAKKQMVDILLSSECKATRDKWVSVFCSPPLPLQPPPMAASPHRRPLPPNVPTRSTVHSPTPPLPKVPLPTRPFTTATAAASEIEQQRPKESSSRNPDIIPKKNQTLVRPSGIRESSVQNDQGSSTSLQEAVDKSDTKSVSSEAALNSFQRPKTILEDETGEWTKKLEEMIEINSHIEFSKGIASLALLTSSRWLVKTGVLTQYPQEPPGRTLFRPKPFKCEFILFNDLLLVSKQKKDNSYMITNHCMRNLVKVSKDPISPHFLTKNKVHTQEKFVLLVSFIENHAKKREDLVFSCEDPSDTDAWVALFQPPKPSESGEITYEKWDCPTVRIIRQFEALKPNEMSVNVNETITVIRKCSNGMYEGERQGDHRRGLFPVCVTLELPSEYARAKALRETFDKTNFSV